MSSEPEKAGEQEASRPVILDYGVPVRRDWSVVFNLGSISLAFGVLGVYWSYGMAWLFALGSWVLPGPAEETIIFGPSLLAILLGSFGLMLPGRERRRTRLRMAGAGMALGVVQIAVMNLVAL